MASIPDAEVRSSEINPSFLSTVPLPWSSGSFCRFSKTFAVVSLCEKRVFCFFLEIIFSATNPKSPRFLHFEIISFGVSPDALAKDLMHNCSEMPNSFSE